MSGCQVKANDWENSSEDKKHRVKTVVIHQPTLSLDLESPFIFMKSTSVESAFYSSESSAKGFRNALYSKAIDGRFDRRVPGHDPHI